jgi:uncharacterized protein
MSNVTDEPYRRRIHSLQQQAVRDLAWCCFSPPLMEKLPELEAHILPFCEDKLWNWLAFLDHTPGTLIEHLAQLKSTRLGIYYEALWRFYFTHHPDWELLQYNLQIDHQGITLGAFDFLCRYKNDYFHIETAVKFYLCCATTNTEALAWNTWLGPNSSDRLDIKLTHLSQHQLPLHQLPEATSQLQPLHPNIKDWKTGLCMQGYLFSHVHTQYQPAFSHKNHSHGLWWHLEECIEYLQKQPGTNWLILERHHWLSPAHTTDINKLFNATELTAQLVKLISAKKRPLLIATVIHTDIIQNNKNVWRESLRGFVVPNDWPTT